MTIDIYQDIDPKESIFISSSGYCNIKQVNVWERFGRVYFTFKDARNEKDYPFLNPAVTMSLEEFNSLMNKIQAAMANQ